MTSELLEHLGLIIKDVCGGGRGDGSIHVSASLLGLEIPNCSRTVEATRFWACAL